MELKVQIPVGQSGDWQVERHTVSRHEATIGALRGIQHGGRYVPEGTYTGLLRGQTLVMSDTPDELRDLFELLHRAKTGRVLVAGLGLGCAVQFALKSPGVEKVTVVEISPDVIKLVAPTLLKAYEGRLEVVEADIFRWKPPDGVRYTAAWFDIWDDICGDNLPEMTKLKRKFARRADWKGCWCEHQLRRQERWEKQHAFWR